MPRKLKTYQTSLGFFDLAIAAPSMKAALQAWGADRNLFHDGVAKVSDDADVIAATMAVPGVVLKRPVGSRAPFKEHAELPTNIPGGKSKKAGDSATKNKHQQRTDDPAVDRKAAIAFEREQKRRERERAKEEATRQKERERRQHAVDKAQVALNAAREKHQKNAAKMQAEREALEKTWQNEEARWEKERVRLEAALRQVQG